MLKTRYLPAAALALFATTATWAQAPAKPKAPSPTPAAAEAGRDWNRIDTNRDGLVSPEEMEKWLAENPGPAKK